MQSTYLRIVKYTCTSKLVTVVITRLVTDLIRHIIISYRRVPFFFFFFFNDDYNNDDERRQFLVMTEENDFQFGFAETKPCTYKDGSLWCLRFNVWPRATLLRCLLTKEKKFWNKVVCRRSEEKIKTRKRLKRTLFESDSTKQLPIFIFIYLCIYLYIR